MHPNSINASLIILLLHISSQISFLEVFQLLIRHVTVL